MNGEVQKIMHLIDRMCQLEAIRLGPPRVIMSSSGEVAIITPDPSEEFKQRLSYLKSLIVKLMRIHRGIPVDRFPVRTCVECGGEI